MIGQPVVVYGDDENGRVLRQAAIERARELAQALRLPRVPKVVSARSPESVHGMLRPVVLDVIGLPSPEFRQTLAACLPVYMDARTQEAMRR